MASNKKLPGDSIYQMGSKWITSEGKMIELKDFAGKPTILSMVFLSCKYLCPTIISEIQKVESKIDPKIREKIRVVLVSFDPKSDTPQVMKAYAKKRKLDNQHWVFITNKDDSKIRELAAILNFKYKKEKDGDFTHSFMYLFLNEKGEILSRVDSAEQDTKQIVEAINKLKF
jgi:protein SCO1/2